MSWVWEDGLAGEGRAETRLGSGSQAAALGCGSWGAQGKNTAGPTWWEHLNEKLRVGVLVSPLFLSCFVFKKINIFFFFLIRP